MAKTRTIVGIEFDDVHIRAVRVHFDSTGAFPRLEGARLLSGSYEKDEEIVEGLKKIRDEVGYHAGDIITACLGGKQQFVGQFPFRKVPRNELDSALRFEIKKHIPFDTSSAVVEYQVLGDDPGTGEEYQIMAAAVQRVVMNRTLALFSKAGMKPEVLDILPLALANAYTKSREERGGEPSLVLHIGPGISNLVFTGDGAPFFNRSVYFTASELFAAEPKVDSAKERERRLNTFSEEVHRSLSYYTSTYHPPEISAVLLAGEYGKEEDVVTRLQEKTGLAFKPLQLYKSLKPDAEDDRGEYALAASLALRSDIL